MAYIMAGGGDDTNYVRRPPRTDMLGRNIGRKSADGRGEPPVTDIADTVDDTAITYDGRSLARRMTTERPEHWSRRTYKRPHGARVSANSPLWSGGYTQTLSGRRTLPAWEDVVGKSADYQDD